MNLYNMLHGTNPLAGGLLHELELDPAEVGRFRDCYLHYDEEAARFEIHVYTRNGGGNRSEYEDVTEALQAHEGYLWDRDDDFDFTYATYAFKTTESLMKQLNELLAGNDRDEVMAKLVPDLPKDKWAKALDALKDGP